MTDKQIIIDGVDVSGCPHYIHKDGSCSSHDCECVKCVHNVCFYKDYKAKEQECEELKEKFQDMKKSRDIALKEYNEEFEYKRQITVEHLEQKKELLKQLDQLKAENETLKQYKASKQASYEEMQKRWNEVEQENRQLKRQHEGDKGLITATGKHNYQLIQEYDRLKTENEELRKNLVDKHTSRCFRLVTHREYNELLKGMSDLRQENKKLKQTLTEIQEIAEMAIKEMYATKSDDYTDGYRWLGSIILQKISEVEE